MQLEGGTVSALLPSWMAEFAYTNNMIPLGDGSLDVRAWLALEATNTAEGVKSPIVLDTVARSHVELGPSGVVDESRSWIGVENAQLPALKWTATGGEVAVRQAVAESLGPVTLDDGRTRRPRGSLFVDARLPIGDGGSAHLYMDCLQGKQVRDGETHTDELPGTFGTFSVPGFAGKVGDTSLPEPVDADLLTNAGPPRAGAGQAAVLSSSSLRLRLTDAQRDLWFGNATDITVSGTLRLAGARSAEGTQEVEVERTATVPADGAVTLTLPLPNSTWTPTGTDGVDVRGARTLALDATAGGVTKQLTLTRITEGEPYPFARILRPGAPPASVTPTPTATPTPVATAAPVVTPTPTPTPTPKAGVAGVASKSLKVKSNRVSASLSCTGQTTCRGTVQLRSATKVKKKFVTLSKSVKYTVAAGKKATVRLTLSSAGKKFVRSKKRVSVVLDVKPASGKTVSKKLTLSR
ncbi:hypothetical protein DVA67_001125 [Solirubrobacter sp. CPCC 204708]|uniref:Htaa domain-containing protein n=1 Tax=Solirubrobacter deserti TaxID=2282478 RepID=A0ABT4RDH8_9ACTN|nr:hypothetical protein [Solirubrobacter deserti]MBE2314561.1 hypothetical protein [Solirubrobacter deserti]MDA0136565.1 hypothetical protein [Solirubrobacter deserti]